MALMPDPEETHDEFVLPRIPASAGALIFDGTGRLLIVNPTYKKHWTIPGGIMESDGETPWEGCRREVREEVGLDVTRGHLVAVDFLRPRRTNAGGMRFLFDCGVMSDEELSAVTLQEEELSEYRVRPVPDALEILSGPLRRRVGEAMGTGPGRVRLPGGRAADLKPGRTSRRYLGEPRGAPARSGRDRPPGRRPAHWLCRGPSPGCRWTTSAAPTRAPTNMQTTDVARRVAFGFLPPASHESAASPVSVVVTTVVVMSATPMRRTTELRIPMAKASTAITV